MKHKACVTGRWKKSQVCRYGAHVDHTAAETLTESHVWDNTAGLQQGDATGLSSSLRDYSPTLFTQLNTVTRSWKTHWSPLRSLHQTGELQWKQTDRRVSTSRSVLDYHALYVATSTGRNIPLNAMRGIFTEDVLGAKTPNCVCLYLLRNITRFGADNMTKKELREWCV